MSLSLCIQSVNVKSNTFLYVGSNVFVQALVEFGVSKLSVAFVDVPSFIHNNRTRTFVGGFYNYILSLFKLAYGLSFCSSMVILSRFWVSRGYVKFNSVRYRLAGGGGGGGPSNLAMERSVVLCRVYSWAL